MRDWFVLGVDPALLRRYLVPKPQVRPGDENAAADCGFAALFMPMFGSMFAAVFVGGQDRVQPFLNAGGFQPVYSFQATVFGVRRRYAVRAQPLHHRCVNQVAGADSRMAVRQLRRQDNDFP